MSSGMKCCTDVLCAIRKQGLRVHELILNPVSFSSVSPPFMDELRDIIRMITGDAELTFKMRAFDKRMVILCNVVKESFKDPDEQIKTIEKIKKLAFNYLKKTNTPKAEENLREIYTLMLTPNLFSDCILKQTYPVVQSKEKIDLLIENLWAMISVLQSIEYDDEVMLLFFQNRMVKLCQALEDTFPEHIPWRTLEHLSFMQKTASKIFQLVPLSELNLSAASTLFPISSYLSGVSTRSNTLVVSIEEVEGRLDNQKGVKLKKSSGASSSSSSFSSKSLHKQKGVKAQKASGESSSSSSSSSSTSSSFSLFDDVPMGGVLPQFDMGMEELGFYGKKDNPAFED
jgi:hypothetical protein